MQLSKLKATIALILAIIFGGAAGWLIDINIRPTEEVVNVEDSSELVLAEEQVPALVENEVGEIVEENLPTVEVVDGDQLTDESVLEGLDLGQGAYYDVSSPEAFKNAVIGKCIDMDGKWGAQCVDLANAFGISYANRYFSTCGTGAARGIWQCRDQNAGDDYVLGTDPTQIQAGDIVVTGDGTYGHVFIAMGPYNNGYVAALGENQGGKSCSGGGAAANVINLKLKGFLGYFRPKIYIKPAPTPEPEPSATTNVPVSNCVQWHVLKGDTMSKIMLECENTVVYGEAMDAYAKTWYSLVVKPGQSVYEGWKTGTHYGLYAGDDIEHRTGQ